MVWITILLKRFSNRFPLKNFLLAADSFRESSSGSFLWIFALTRKQLQKKAKKLRKRVVDGCLPWFLFWAHQISLFVYPDRLTQCDRSVKAFHRRVRILRFRLLVSDSEREPFRLPEAASNSKSPKAKEERLIFSHTANIFRRRRVPDMFCGWRSRTN